MGRICTTSGYKSELYRKVFTMENFFDDAVKSGAGAVEIGVEFFPERAMYWTRMARTKAEKLNMKVAAIVRETNLIDLSGTEAESSRADLQEWIRIAALSKISVLKIVLMHSGARMIESNEAAALFKPLADYAKSYGTRLVLEGSANVSDALLLSLVKKLDYHIFRIAPKAVFSDPHDGAWAAAETCCADGRSR